VGEGAGRVRRARLTGLDDKQCCYNAGINNKGATMSQQLVLDSDLEQEKQTARLLYIVHGLTFFFSFGLLSFIPLILNYVKRPYTQGTMVYTHHTWMIRSFWYYILWIVVAAAMWVTIILIPLGWLIGIVAWLWKAYRLIKGFVDLNNNRPMPV
jgi:uncharacterized membrane protein